MRSIIGDIRDLDSLKKAMKEANPDILIHMAAQPLVRYSYIQSSRNLCDECHGYRCMY
jgi:CDP-glucose 4,6-dehydratase